MPSQLGHCEINAKVNKLFPKSHLLYLSKIHSMKVSRIFIALFSLALLALSSCCVCKKQGHQQASIAQLPGPQVIIYQTKKDCSKLVPVILSDDKKSVISYPDIRDIVQNGKYPYPTPLNNGFYLDNRGISANVAFIRLSYEEYAALPSTPTADELYGMILYKDPVRKMYACGLKNKFTDLEKELNAAIDAGNFSSFTRIR